MMNRRAFVTGVGAVLAAPLCVDGQAVGRVPARIGYVGNADAKTVAKELEAFAQGLREMGWVEGQTITIEYLWARGRLDRIPMLIDELVRLKIDVIVVSGAPAVQAAQQATKSIPIVIAAVFIDPVAGGFVRSLARPGGNITGLASQYEEIVTKQVQLLTELVPGLSRLALLRHESGSPETTMSTTAHALSAAEKAGVKAQILDVKEASEIDRVFQSAREGRAQAAQVLPSPFFNSHRRLLVKSAAHYRLPVVYEFSEYAQDGGLMSFGVDLAGC